MKQSKQEKEIYELAERLMQSESLEASAIILRDFAEKCYQEGAVDAQNDAAKAMEEYASIKLAEKDKEIERLKEQIVNANEFILEVAKYEKETTSTRFRLWAKAYIKKYTNINIESLNK